MLSRLIFSVFLIVFFPSFSLASGAEHHGHTPGIESLFWPSFNFVLYLALMSYFYRKLGRPALIGKAVSVKEQIEKGQQALSIARQDLADLERRDIEAEKKELHERIIGEGNTIAASVFEDAKLLARKLERDVELRIRRDFAKAEDNFKIDVIKKASDLVKKELGSSLTESQDRELRKDALRSVLN